MSREEEAYTEALRRIREAQDTGATVLDLGINDRKKDNALIWLKQIPRELERLTTLEALSLSGCMQLGGDLWPLARLSSLQWLNLCACKQLNGDLTPLASLTSLRTLYLIGWDQLSDLSPLAALTSLQSLFLTGCIRPNDALSSLPRLASVQLLDLSACQQLSDLSPLRRLTSLRTLNLALCPQLTDLSPLADLTSLQKLDLVGCKQLSDLSPLSNLTSLRVLHLSDCLGVRRFAPLECLLPTLQEICLSGCQFEDLPAEVCGEGWRENVLDKVRAHYKDLIPGQRPDAEVKVLFLGNGASGKSQLCRRLHGEPFDPSVPTTHGIQLSPKTLLVEGIDDPVRLNLWDFGGQEIYHGSHTLFLQGEAVFLILWTPALEGQMLYQEGELSLGHRPIAYWLDYLRAFAGVKSPVLLIQSQCDTPGQRAPLPKLDVDDFTTLQRVQVSAKTGLGLDLVTAALKEAVRDCLYRRPPPPIGAGRMGVRNRLRRLLDEDQKLPATQRRHRILERAQFDRLCDAEGRNQ